MQKCQWWVLCCLVMSFLLIGCGGSSDSPAPEGPSAAEFPFGVTLAGLTSDYGDRSFAFVYDDAGRVVEMIETREFDFDSDDRIDVIEETVFTIDPDLTVIQVPEAEPDAEIDKAVTRYNINFGTFLEYLPGAVTSIDHRIYGYDADLFRLAQIPEEMVMVGHYTDAWIYDEAGRLLKREITEENSDRIETRTVTHRYDTAGKLVKTSRVERVDLHKDGWIDENDVIEIDYTYDPAGNLARKEWDEFNGSDLQVTTYIYDDAGLLVAEEYQVIAKSDETVSHRHTKAYSYDANGNLAEMLETLFTMSIDGWVPGTVITHGYSYDSQGRVAEHVEETDADADPGTPNTTRTRTYAYGELGPTFYRYRNSGSSCAEVYEYSYHERGKLAGWHHIWDCDIDTDDTFDFTGFIYDAQGRLVSVEESDHDALDGPPTWKHAIVFVYDEDGRLAEWREERFENGSDMTSRQITSIAYSDANDAATVTFEAPVSSDPAGVGISAVYPGEVSMRFSFDLGAPTATMELPLFDNWEAALFGSRMAPVPVPALFGFYANMPLMIR